MRLGGKGGDTAERVRLTLLPLTAPFAPDRSETRGWGRSDRGIEEVRHEAGLRVGSDPRRGPPARRRRELGTLLVGVPAAAASLGALEAAEIIRDFRGVPGRGRAEGATRGPEPRTIPGRAAARRPRSRPRRKRPSVADMSPLRRRPPSGARSEELRSLRHASAARGTHPGGGSESGRIVAMARCREGKEDGR